MNHFSLVRADSSNTYDQERQSSHKSFYPFVYDCERFSSVALVFDARGCASLVGRESSKATTRVRQCHSTSITPCEPLLYLASPLLWSRLGWQVRDTGRRRCATDRLARSAGTTLVTHENILSYHEQYGCLIPHKANTPAQP